MRGLSPTVRPDSGHRVQRVGLWPPDAPHSPSPPLLSSQQALGPGPAGCTMAALCPVWKLFMDGGLPSLRASSPFGQPETASTPEDFPLAQGGITLLPDWGGGAAKALPLAPGLPPLPLTGQAPLSGLDCSPCPSPESPLWVCPGPGFLAASLERHEAGCNLTDMWHSLGTCPAHVLPRGGVGGAWCLELPRWLLQEPNVILAASSVLEGAE